MSYSRLEGTTSDEFTIGKGDLDNVGDPIVGHRTTSGGLAEYRQSGPTTAWVRLGALADVLLEPTGFENPENVIVTYNAGSRTITLTGTVSAYWRGTPVTALVTGWESPAHPVSPTVPYFLFYDGTSFAWSTTVWNFSALQIAYLAVANGGAEIFGVRETHGTMAWPDHEEFHDKVGTYRKSGGDVTGFAFNSTTLNDRRPFISSCTLKDEDLASILDSHTTLGNYTRLHLTGANGTVNLTLSEADIAWLTGGSAQWNEFTGGVWTGTTLTNNQHTSLWLIGIPTASDTGSQAYRYVWMAGQSAGTLNNQRAQSPNDLFLGEFAPLSPEFIFLEQVIIQETGAGDWEVIEQHRLSGSKVQYVSGPSGGVTDHAALTGLENYDHPQYAKRPAHTLTVSKTEALGAGDFSVIQAAIDSITVTGPDDYYVINIYPGTYIEDVVLKDNVDLQGFGGQIATIEGSLSWPSSTCTDGAWSNVDNITVQNSAMIQGQSILIVEAGWHYVTNCYVYGMLDGVSGTLISQSGGQLDLLTTAVEYEHTGASVSGTNLPHVCIEHSGGSFDSFQTEYYISTEDTVQNVNVYHGLSSGFTYGDWNRIAYGPIFVLTPFGFAGNSRSIYMETGATPVLVQSNNIQVIGIGGSGLGFLYYLQASTTVESSGNVCIVNGFSLDHSDYTTDNTSLLSIKFDSIFASDGRVGLGAPFVGYLQSAGLGDFSISGNMSLTDTATVDGRDVSSDGSALDNQVTHAFVDNTRNQISALIEKTTLVDDDVIVIEDSENLFVKRKAKKSSIGGLSQHALDSTSAHSAPTDNTNFNASALAHGFLKKLDGNALHFLNGEGNWEAIPSLYRYHEYGCHMTGIASNTNGMFSKGPPSVANPSGIPTTTPYDVYINGGIAPWLITTAQDLTTLDVTVGAAAVSQATVGTTPTIRIDIYSNLGGSGAPKRTLLGTYRLPVVSGAADIKNYNDLSGTALIRFRLVLGTVLPLTEGMLMGAEFVNEITGNTTINAIKSAVLVATAVSISATPTGYQLTIAPTAPSAPNTGDVWVDNS